MGIEFYTSATESSQRRSGSTIDYFFVEREKLFSILIEYINTECVKRNKQEVRNENETKNFFYVCDIRFSVNFVFTLQIW